MPSMKIVVPHSLSREEVMSRIQKLLGEVKNDHGEKMTDLRETWTDSGGEFAFKAMGFSVSGTLAVTPGEVEMKGNFPFAAMPFKGRIETIIRERATKLLAS